jgi:hypothetical protein
MRSFKLVKLLIRCHRDCGTDVNARDSDRKELDTVALTVQQLVSRQGPVDSEAVKLRILLDSGVPKRTHKKIKAGRHYASHRIVAPQEGAVDVVKCLQYSQQEGQYEHRRRSQNSATVEYCTVL